MINRHHELPFNGKKVDIGNRELFPLPVHRPHFKGREPRSLKNGYQGFVRFRSIEDHLPFRRLVS